MKLEKIVQWMVIRRLNVVLKNLKASFCFCRIFPKIFEGYSNAEGFMFLKDDTILNFWNLVQADKSKLWITHKVSASWAKVSLDSNSSKWYFKDGGRDTVKKLLSDLPVHR